jgi:hypothetical protein
MQNPDGVHYRAHYSNGPDGNSIFHLYFDDQAQADKACEAVVHASREIVMIQTRYGKATLSLNYNFVGLFPTNNGEPVNGKSDSDESQYDPHAPGVIDEEAFLRP